MTKLNPIQESKFIESEFREYLKDTFNFKDKEYQEQFIKELDEQSLYKGPFLSVSLPFVSTKSINELIEEGRVSPLFRNLSNIKLEQKLYKHQEQSLDKICSGRNVVITTGTGSGKTESFLYPVLNSILRDIENGNNGPGIRAILLYPMNALINDQIDRVRKILTGFPEIRYGFFTGETKENENSKRREELSKLTGMEIPENEIISRKEIRENPPHLLFTNYSMLEYLLIRPNDFKIFTPDYLKHWKFVILDEAHTYNGALGIEVSLLLRRLTGLADKKPNFLLTSATLGKKNRDEKDIISFAESLTSSKFDEDDIIFSTRTNLDINNIKYTVDPSLYPTLDKSLDDIDAIKELLKSYIPINTDNVSELLYNFLISDRNIYDLYNYLSLNNYTFSQAMELLRPNRFFKDEELISLIHLINIARKDKKNLYDIKYHTFIRTLSGAYVTLAPSKLMKLSSCYYINNLRTFELGNCRYCNAPFIFGKVRDGYLRQNSDIDIYENYGDNENILLDYYLLSDSIDDDFNESLCEEHILCSNCGLVYNPANKNATVCDCSNEYKVKVYKVRSSLSKNNISECPCCGRDSSRGIVRSVNLGKDEATAILAQILYKAIDNNEERENKVSQNLSFSFETSEKQVKKDKYVKQFITFSDSRQQASFFASFFEYNHNRFLRRKLIWEVLKNNNFNDMKFDVLISKLEQMIQGNDLFPDSSISINKQAWVTGLHELLNVDGAYGAEGLGLFYFALDIEWILNQIGDEGINYEFGKHNINKQDLFNIYNVIFNVFRTAPAIDYTSAGLTPEERKENLGYRKFENYVKLKKAKLSGDKNQEDDSFKKDGNVKSLLPVSEKLNNMVLDYIIRVCKCDRQRAIDIISKLFNVGIQSGLLTKVSKINDDIYQISTDKYILKSYNKNKFYKCSKCGQLTPFNVHNVCPTNECRGILSECNPDEELKHNYYRREYIDKKIERVSIKEHTAQLEVETAKKYQKDFKHKNINILSCSTTFEMGVDIGGLETVFMRNVPPTPANYVQRAGRAGRSDDSSAFVLTFCGNSSHDYTYFEDPSMMISGEIKPPKFKITNEKIILRHLLATSFGMFFRQNEEYFTNIDSLVCNGGIERFKNYLYSKPEALNKFVNEKLLDNDTYEKYGNFKWLDCIVTNGDFLSNFEKAILDLISQFETAKENAIKDDLLVEANYYKSQISKIKNEKVIQNLSKYNVIPKYGFPVDVVELQIWNNGEYDHKYDLSRDLSIAISEYAPESEVIVDKQKYTSRYITLPKADNFTKYYYYTCKNCERDNVSVIKDRLTSCTYCGTENDEVVNTHFIEPIYGFKTGVNKESSTKKPKKTYAGATSYIGDGTLDDEKMILGKNEYVIVETSSDDKLLVMNKNPFFMCDECGYSEIIKGKYGVMSYPSIHLNYRGRQCSCETIKPLSLGHMFKTDVASIRIKDLNNKPKALSVLYALLEGISQEFNIERRDIDGLVVKNKFDCYDLIIYDNVPGGAGHVKRVMNEEKLRETFGLALKKVEQNCCDIDSSCYNCLRNYNNQSYHGLLKRRVAIETLKNILDNI